MTREEILASNDIGFTGDDTSLEDSLGPRGLQMSLTREEFIELLSVMNQLIWMQLEHLTLENILSWLKEIMNWLQIEKLYIL